MITNPKKLRPLVAGTACCLAALLSATAAETRKPNVVVILADDLGYGDVQCYNPQRGKIPTPNMDRLATQGMRFTDGHSSSGVCSPSRYTLLTGRYHWRTRLQSGIVGVFGAPLIAPDRLTIAGLLKQNGYQTACVGKWHLGWDWPIPSDQAARFHAKPEKDEMLLPAPEQKAVWNQVFSQVIPGGPTTRGFDSYFGTDVPNWPPYCFIDNDRTMGLPSAFLDRDLFKNHMASLQGPALEHWKLEGILPALGERASQFLERAGKEVRPFFLYLPLTSPHTPLAVTDAWRGKSGLNPYADWVMETDALVGRVLAALERSGAADNTLLVFTSDNGCAPYVGAPELEQKGHYPSGPLRGYKADVWEGGHRIPFIVRWPGVVRPGSQCDQLVLHADLMATFAEVLGVTLPDNAGEDSFSLLPLLKGGQVPTREFAINQAAGGVPSVRQGPWKMIFGPARGSAETKHLYNLAEDLGETRNVCAERPEKAAELTALMERLVDNGRSTPGAKQANDQPFNWQRFMDAPRPAKAKQGAKKKKS